MRKIFYFDHSKDLQSERKRNIAMIDQLNNKMTILTGEIKLLQGDKGTGLYIFAFHNFNNYRIMTSSEKMISSDDNNR